MPGFHIVFYHPRSFFHSFLGVVMGIVLLLLPMALVLVYLYFSGTKNSQYWLLAPGLVAGFILRRYSEPIVFPMVGERQEYFFSENAVRITEKNGETIIHFSQLKDFTVFQVDAESGSVNHISLETLEGKKYHIFDTWVTRASSADFDKVMKWRKSILEGGAN